MITLLKLNLLSKYTHVVYSRNKNNSINLIKDIFKEMNFPIECRHDGTLTDKEVEDISKNIKKEDNIINDGPSVFSGTTWTPGTAWTPGTTWTPGTACVSGCITLSGYDGTSAGSGIISGMYDYNYDNKRKVAIYYNKPYHGTSYSVTTDNIDNFDYNIYIIDDLKMFLDYINSFEDNYYYLNDESYKGEELLEFIANLLGENNEQI